MSGLAIALGVGTLFFMAKQARLGYLLLAGGLVVGLFLNLNFWLAAGYTSPSTDGLNLLMMIVEALGIFYIFPKLAGKTK